VTASKCAETFKNKTMPEVKEKYQKLESYTIQNVVERFDLNPDTEEKLARHIEHQWRLRNGGVPTDEITDEDELEEWFKWDLFS
jgi:hypothetical protein